VAAADIAIRGHAKPEGRCSLGDRVFHALTLLFAIIVLLILSGVIVALVAGSLPALRQFGLGFLVTDAWNPVTERFGAVAPIYGTQHIEPAMIDTFGRVPGIGALFAGPPLGIGVLTAGFILAVMVLPFISSIMRDVFETVPPVLKESTYALGATTTEVVWKVVLPFTRIGVVGGILLGLGRALGETMAVTFVIGNSHHVNLSILQPGTTISAALANEFTEALGDLYQSSLITLGLILFVITFIVLAVAKLLLIRVERQAGG
jgi:phosphate transport system permease protein